MTLIYQTLTGEAEAMQAMFPKEAGPYWKRARDWRDFVARVLAEEHTTYGIDDHCNVRYAVDEAYALARRATLNGLQGGDWAAVRPEFERAFEALDGEPDPNAAVRAIAAAVESCLKTVIGNGVPRVGPAEIERYLWPKISDLHANDRAAADASHQILKSLGFWIVGSHQYRHGQDGAAEVRAPIELAVQFLSLGAAHIRWLIELQFKLKAAN